MEHAYEDAVDKFCHALEEIEDEKVMMSDQAQQIKCVGKEEEGGNKFEIMGIVVFDVVYFEIMSDIFVHQHKHLLYFGLELEGCVVYNEHLSIWLTQLLILTLVSSLNYAF